MRHITIVASGSRGDVQPYIAMGKGLRSAGHHVRLLASENFEPLVKEAGLDFCSTGISIEEIIQTDEWRKVTESGNFIALLGKMQQEMKRHVTALIDRLPDLLKGSDLIVAGMAGLGAVSAIAESFKIPTMQAYVFPFTPTRAFPAPITAKLPFGKALNHLSFRVLHQMFWQTSKMGDAMARKRLGMGKGPFWGPFRAMAQSDSPVLYGYSRHLLPRPQDWAEKYHVTGHWFLDAPAEWTPPPAVAQFLEAGSPPVYIGFGSMGSRNPEAVGKIALDALERSGQRGVLATGWGGLKTSNVPATVHLIASIPHSWLFPRMAAVVHHGGVGTTAAGLRAGVPSIIVPFMADQPFWGQRVADLGVGVAPIPRRQLTSERLAAAITATVTDAPMRQRAAALGEAVRAEDGVGNAVAVIERYLKQR